MNTNNPTGVIERTADGADIRREN